MSKYDKALLERVVRDAKSLRQVILSLGLNESGGNYLTVKKRLQDWKINTDHFLGKSASKGMTPNNAASLEEIFTNKRFVKSNALKARLVKAGLLAMMCAQSECGITEWHGAALVLELDHIDGNRKNNALSNLRLLCPNCHSQTMTWRGRKVLGPSGGKVDTPA